MRKTYEEFGCGVIDVPEMPVKDRLNLFLVKLEKTTKFSIKIYSAYYL